MTPPPQHRLDLAGPYANYRSPRRVGDDFLCAIRPTEQDGRQFMRLLQRRLERRGLGGLYRIFMISRHDGVTFVWLRSA